MGNAAFGIFIGICYMIITLLPSKKDEEQARKDAYVQVYEGKVKCEKALNTWVCSDAANTEVKP